MAKGNGKGREPAADADSPPGANQPSDTDVVKVARLIIKKDTEIAEAREAMNSLIGERRGFVKAAKKQGINQTMLLRVIEERKLEVEDVARDNRDYLRYTMLLNKPLGTQFDLWAAEPGEIPGLEGEEAQTQRVFDAEEAGYHAGRNGHKRDTNPYHQTDASELFTAFNGGWIRGQATIAKAMGPKDKVTKAPTEIRKPSRRAADKAPETPLEKDEATFRGQGTDQSAAE